MKKPFLALAILPFLLAGTSAASAAKPLDLKVMSFNIRTGHAKDGENRWELRRDQLFDLIRRHAPDLVGLQEANRFQIDEKTVGTYNAFKGKADGEKIDYIFATPDIQPLEATIIRENRNGRYPSDHFPIEATLRLGGPTLP